MVNLPLEILGRAWKNFPHSDKDTSEGAASCSSEGRAAGAGSLTLGSETAAVAQGTLTAQQHTRVLCWAPAQPHKITSLSLRVTAQELVLRFAHTRTHTSVPATCHPLCTHMYTHIRA